MALQAYSDDHAKALALLPQLTPEEKEQREKEVGTLHGRSVWKARGQRGPGPERCCGFALPRLLGPPCRPWSSTRSCGTLWRMSLIAPIT